MHITHISSEFSPFAKAGGLGDVLHGLSKQQVKNGHSVNVVMPKYDVIDIRIFDSIEIYLQDLWSYEDGVEYHNTVYKALFEGVTIFLIEPHHNSYYFNRGCIYGAINDVERFLYFSRTCVQFLNNEALTHDVLHLHDWPVAAVAPLIRHLAPKLDEKIKSIVFNIHNIEHQGKIHPKHLSRIGLNGAQFLTKDTMQDPISPELINLMKGGITYSDKVITVSPTYSQEIRTPEYGFGLHHTIEKFKTKVHGILNGIETETWNPSTDVYLPETFPPNSTYINQVLQKKGMNKAALYKELNLNPTSAGPLIICVTRIASQKSPELIMRAIEQTEENGGCFVLLGTIAEKPTEKKFLLAKEKYKDNPNIHLCFQFNEELSHKLFGAADAIIIPSKFEPCGLTQIIAMRYGTIPIVRNTGGLSDTVTDIKKTLPTGFVFDDLTLNAIDSTLEQVFKTYHLQQSIWKTMIQNGLNRDCSWNSPSNLYEKVYLEVSDAAPCSSKIVM